MPRHPDLLIERRSQPAAAALIAASGAAVVATGSVEQHGGHLPLGTDAFAAASIAERVAARLGTVVASLGPAGVAPYHRPWPVTLSLRPATLAAVMRARASGRTSKARRNRPRTTGSAPPPWASSTRSRGCRPSTPAMAMCAPAIAVSIGVPTEFHR